ncbi:flippase [Patescibacteria group bacterium]|nr:flippase [Patescibacteria group bacterium]
MSTKALARNTALQIAGKTLATLFGLLTVAVLTRYLGTAGYGQLTIVLTFLSVFAVIVDFGLTLTTTQMISEHKAKEENLLGNLLSLRIISAILFLALAPIVAIFFPYDQIVKVAIAVGVLSYLFGSTSQMFIGVFQKRLVIGRFVLAELINRAAVLVGAAAAPLLGLDLIGIVWILVLGNALQLISIIAFARRYVRLRFRLNLTTWKEIISRSWPIGASIFFNLIYLRGDIVFLSLYRSEAEVGLYGAAYKVVDVVTAVPVMFMGLALPILIASWGGGVRAKFKEHMQSFLDFMTVAALPIAFGSIAVGPALMAFVAGDDFRESGEVLTVLGPAAAVVFFGALFGHAIVALNKQRVMLWGYLAVAVVTVVGYLIFIPIYGMWAAAWLTLISEVLITLLTFIVVSKVSGYRPKFKTVAIATGASIIMLLGLLIIPSVHVLVDVALGAIIYTIALVALGGPKPKDVIRLFLPEKPPISQP